MSDVPFAAWLAGLSAGPSRTVTAVEDTADFRRIRDAERVDWRSAEELPALTRLLSNHLRTRAGTQELRPIQAATLRYVYDRGSCFVPLRTGGGKAQPVSEPVATPDGWCPIGSLRVGDQVIGSAGTPVTVTGVFPQGRRDIFRVEFSTGVHTFSCAEHLWTLRPRTSLRTFTQPLYAWMGHEQELWYLPTMAPLALPEAAVPLDPYTLGALLGDGGMSQPHHCSFTSMDPEIVDALQLPGGVHARPTRHQNSGRAVGYRLVGAGGSNQLLHILRELRLQGLRSEEKHIPEMYKRGSIEQRLALLQGLFDTDGSCPRGEVSYSTSSPQLAADVREIVHSLGGRASVHCRETRHLPHYVMTVNLPPTMQRFRLRRKNDVVNTDRKRTLDRRLRSIEPAGQADCVCIAVDAPDRLYATRHYLLTHNTHISYLAAEVVGAKRPLLIVPAKMLNSGKVHREHAKARDHWKLRPLMSARDSKTRRHHNVDFHPLRVISYEALSRVDYEDALTDWAPDLLVLDEAHKCKDPGAAVTRRVGRFVRNFSPQLLLMSGSFMNRALKDYAHLLRWCLRDATPLPKDWHELRAWGWALDEKVPDGVRVEPGALLQLSPPLDDDGDTDIDRARKRYGRRLLSTPGVISSGDDLPAVGLTARRDVLEPDAAMRDAVHHLRTKWQTPCGLPFELAVDLWRHEREVSCGLYYRWDEQPPPEWLLARRAWSSFVREVLSRSRTYDSPLHVANAIDAGKIPDGGILATWRRVQGLFDPAKHQEAVWISDLTVNHCAKWLEKEQGICWVYHRAFGERLSAVSGVPYFSNGGKDPSGKSIDEHRGPAIASISSVNEGFNLQELHFKNYVATCPTTNLANEQMISRTHRDGQTADEVELTYLQILEGDRAALRQARADARAVESSMLQPQRLNAATWIDE